MHCIHNHALPLTRLRLTLFALLLISSALHLHKSDLHWSDLHWEQNPHWWWLLWKISEPLQFFDQSLHQLIIVNCTIIIINIGHCAIYAYASDCKVQISDLTWNTLFIIITVHTNHTYIARRKKNCSNKYWIYPGLLSSHYLDIAVCMPIRDTQ